MAAASREMKIQKWAVKRKEKKKKVQRTNEN